MKLRNILLGVFASVTASLGLSSCSYLDVVPVEQPGIQDAMSDYSHALGFLHSCYHGTIGNSEQQGLYGNSNNWLLSHYCDAVSATDEFVAPYTWLSNDEPTAGRQLMNTLSATTCRDDWRSNFIWISQCLQFLKQLDEVGIPNGVADEETYALWRSEVKFLMAFYHFTLLVRYGPIAITENLIDMNTDKSAFSGRYHYDYCVDWIARQLDEAAEGLPYVRTTAETGRATKIMCQAVKARMYLYAASPLFNGNFPYPTWQNETFETPGYGKELVSKSYDPSKWERARQANEELLSMALANGYSLYKDDDYRSRQRLVDQWIPVDGLTDEEEEAYQNAIIRMRAVTTTTSVDDNNHETLFPLNIAFDNTNAVFPHNLFATTNNSTVTGYSGIGPTLNTMAWFLTKDGYMPEDDPNFYDNGGDFKVKGQWYQSAGIDGREDVIKLCTNREPRFYAWLGFDGGDFGTMTYDNQHPVKLELRNSSRHGYNPGRFNRDNCQSGFVSQKHLNPTMYVTAAGGRYTRNNAPIAFMRLAEVYLNLAEIYWNQGDQAKALENLNVVRERAGAKPLTTAMLTNGRMPGDINEKLGMYIRNERFIEFWYEGNHRFYDVRRWMMGDEYFGFQKRYTLDAISKMDPSFEEFNTPIVVPYEYTFGNRQYLYPIKRDELYKNPQLVQSPGY